MKEKIIENFINKVKLIHNNNNYDYSLMNYINAHTKIKIICKEHGIFEQTPESHSKGHGCPKCHGGVKYTSQFFLEKSIKKHGNKYDYSLMNFINSQTKIKIICPEHGLFEQRPSEHLKYGCFKCGIDKRTESKRLSFENFLKQANKIHNDKYVYSETTYRGHKYKIDIICPIHGKFEQITNSHLNGCGCPSCKQSKGEEKIKMFLNNNLIKFTPQKTFKDCVNIKPLPFDFYLSDFNYCIEYDGIQHYKKNYWSEKLDDIKFRDEIKTKYCDGKNGRPNLLRISYKDFNKIDDILKIFII